MGRHTITLTATDASGARDTDRVRVVVAAAPVKADRQPPRLVRARRAGRRAISMDFSEDVVGIGSKSIRASGGGAVTRVDYLPRVRRAIVHFARRIGGRVTVRGPLMDLSGNRIRTRRVALRR